MHNTFKYYKYISSIGYQPASNSNFLIESQISNGTLYIKLPQVSIESGYILNEYSFQDIVKHKYINIMSKYIYA